MMVRFSTEYFTQLTTHRGCTPERVANLTAMQERGFEVQNEPQPGRINFRIPHTDGPGYSYRTFAARNLVAVTA